MLDPESDRIFSPVRMLASRKRLFAPINFFRRIDKISLQNDMSSCKLFALSYMVQAGKEDYLNQLSVPSLRTAAYLMRKKDIIILRTKEYYNITLNPYNITIVPFSSLPDRFIKTAQSTRVLESRKGLSNKSKSPKNIEDEGNDQIISALSKDDPPSPLKKIAIKSNELNFTPDGLVYSVLPASIYLRIEKDLLRHRNKLSIL